MQINTIDRKNETIEIIKNDGEIVDFTFREIDILIDLLFNFKYLIITNNIQFNHHPSEIHLAESINGKYNEKIL